METCDKHKKEYQAYCYEDACLLCLDCMLDHSRSKNHRMESLKDASRKVALIIQHHLQMIQKAEKNFETCSQRFEEFKMQLEMFQQRILQKVHFNQLKIIQQVNDAFEALTAKLQGKFGEILEAGSKVDRHNKDGLATLQALTERMHKVIQTSSETTLIFKYHTMGLAKENVEGTVKKWMPAFDFPTQKSAMNEANFLTVELSKTIDKIKSEITYKNPAAGKKSQSFISFRKDAEQPNPSFVYIEENGAITPDVLAGMAIDIKEKLSKGQDQYVSVSPENGKKLETTVGKVAQPQFFSRRSVNMFEPLPFRPNVGGMRKVGSFAKIGLSELRVDNKKKTQALNFGSSGEKVLIIGGTKSKEFTLKLYDFGNGNFEHRKTNFPAVSKFGVHFWRNQLFIFGGKVAGKATEKVFRYNLIDREMSEVKGLVLSKRKYEFGVAEVMPGVVLLFGGKDELKFPIADIELLDLNRNEARLIGRLGQPKFGLFALRICPDLPLQEEGVSLGEESQGQEEEPLINLQQIPEPDIDRMESINISFNVSRLDSRPSISSQFKYSFEQNPCDLTGFGGQKTDREELLDDDKDFEKFDVLNLETQPLVAFSQQAVYPETKILIIGGQSLSRTILNSVELFNLSTGACHFFAELKEPRKQCWAAHTKLGLLVFGGKGVSRHLSTVETLRGRRFELKTQMSLEKSAFRGIIRGDEIVLLGGKNEKGALNFIETYQMNGKELQLVKKIQTIPSFANFEVVYSNELGSVV